MTAMTKQKNIVIVGGSLGGLFHGVALSRLGHNITILERNPTPLLHDQGAGVVAGSDTQNFFRTYDRTQTPLAVTSHARQYLDREGNVIDYDERPQRMTSWDLLYHILRANLDGVESTYVKAVPGKEKGDGKVVYRYGCTAREVVRLEDEDGVRITMEKHPDKTLEDTTADLVIAADGGSSTVRQRLQPDVHRTYAGYVAWRGTVPESMLSTKAADTLLDRFTFFHTIGVQILAYLIPGPNGNLEKGKRLMNWVWYCNYPESSPEYQELMTDQDGNKHRYTLPPGKMRTAVWEKQKERAVQKLPPQLAELVQKTGVPFVQCITDVLSSRASFLDGKLLLVGDALAGFRPHTAASTSQAAFDAFATAELVRGDVGLEEWEKKVMEYATEVQKHGVMLGQRSQFGLHPLADTKWFSKHSAIDMERRK
ncbi:FAD/NAD(P)-binding domain-containing protein [Saccharata proteae CBS 121410]|uniref:FAD/NAD(P)-binding domain-containing protein n=1 Tax=Saccharata proteae CBS 121410 TaxID=1314787 RepID=A0A9P4HN66_9PEZI|nr:FAD/NAD(P)-binding domain-containing protein [Saccharata proteae CBS 121410]